MKPEGDFSGTMLALAVILLNIPPLLFSILVAAASFSKPGGIFFGLILAVMPAFNIMIGLNARKKPPQEPESKKLPVFCNICIGLAGILLLFSRHPLPGVFLLLTAVTSLKLILGTKPEKELSAKKTSAPAEKMADNKRLIKSVISNTNKGLSIMQQGILTKIILICIVLIAGIWIFSSTIIVVDAGHTGVKKTLGKVADEAYPPGLYIVFPLTTSIIQMDNRVQKLEDETEVYTKDVQQAKIKYALTYTLNNDASVKMYTQVGIFWANTLIPQVVTSSMKNIIGQWAALELIANRGKASQDIEEMIAASLKERGLTITGFSLTNIDFQQEFEQAVEAKVVAVQKAEMAKNQTVQVQEQANQRVIAAKADAEAMLIKTEALTKNQSLIMYEAVQKWNGELPKIVGGSAGGNLLNIPESLLK